MDRRYRSAGYALSRLSLRESSATFAERKATIRFVICRNGLQWSRANPSTDGTFMSYRVIKRILGESSLERKTQILFAVCLLVLITVAFLWVSRITEQLIDDNTRDQANSLKSDFVLRTHLENLESFYTGGDAPSSGIDPKQDATATVFASLATVSPTVPYQATVVTMPGDVGRFQITPEIATDPAEIERLQKIWQVAVDLQAEQNELESLKAFSPNVFNDKVAELEKQKTAIQPANEDPLPNEVTLSTRKKYYFYAPLVFKSQAACQSCHQPTSTNPEIKQQLLDIGTRLASAETTPNQTQLLLKEKFALAPPMFVRITLDNAIAKSAVTKSRAILISVAIATVVLAVAALWTIVRYVIAKPLAHLRDVTEKVSLGEMTVRAEINSGDDFEELAKSINRMLRYVLDTQIALQDVNTDLDKKIDEQAQLALELHEINQVKSEFLANMSHELRTPLNSIIGFSELLESGKGLKEKQVRFATNIRRSGNVLLELINDILDLAKLEAGKMEVRCSEFSLQQMMDDLCEMVRHLADTKNIQLTHTIDADWPMISQDKVKVRQVLTNLLSNAIKFTPEGGRISIRGARLEAYSVSGQDETETDLDQSPPPMLQIEVEDTGVGIAVADQEIIFQKFRQGTSVIGSDSLTREVSGTGLGLSIVKELCVLLGGWVELKSAVGQGSTFTVVLPWQYEQTNPSPSAIHEQVDKVTKNRRVDLSRVNRAPVPTVDDHDSSE